MAKFSGGTRDIAFFTISRDPNPDVHAMISMTKGVNYVLEDCCSNVSMISLTEAQDLSFLLDSGTTCR